MIRFQIYTGVLPLSQREKESLEIFETLRSGSMKMEMTNLKMSMQRGWRILKRLLACTFFFLESCKSIS